MWLYQTPLLIASLLLLCIGSPSGVGAKHSCPPSSCGNLQIRYPFRLKGDKPTCGDRRYELTCHGNKTIFDINSGKYYVKSISYSKGDEHIRITDVGLASDDCALPSNTLSLDTISDDERFTFSTPIRLGGISLYEASFVNCTRETQDCCTRETQECFVNCTAETFETQHWYHPNSYVPCLSRSNAFVYVITDATVWDIAPTSRFVAMVPTNKMNYEMEEDVFKYLQNGFTLNWANPSCDGIPFVVKSCYTVAY